MTLEALQSLNASKVENVKLKSSKVKEYLKLLPNWEVDKDGLLYTEFELEDFKQCLALVNAIGQLAEDHAHHPDILIHDYKYVGLSLFTHDSKGLSEKDFVVAANIEKLIHNE